MWSHLEYRIALLVILMGGMAFSAVLRRRADLAGGQVARTADRPATLLALRMAGTLFYGSLFLWLLHPPLLAWAAVPVSPPWRWTGAVLLLAGVGTALWALWHLGHNVTPTAVTRPDAEMVSSGPYRWVRHPLYSSMLLTVPGCALLTTNLLVLLGGVSTVVVLLWRTGREEEELLDHFGERYATYMERTGRLLPRLGTTSSQSRGHGGPS